MAEQAQQQLKQPPDLTKLPNFDAALEWVKDKERAGHNFGPIKKWMELLQDWCQASVDKLHADEEEDNERIVELEHKLEDADIDAARFHEVREKLEDVTRGVADIEEVYDLCAVHPPMTVRS